MKSFRTSTYWIGATALLITCSAWSSELVYQPVNPNFGGSPLNGNVLLNNAQAQNTYKDPDRRVSGASGTSALDRLSNSLQSRLIGQILSDAEDGTTGFLETDDFSVNITDEGLGGLLITILDKGTNEVSEIQVNGLGSSE